MSHTVSLTRFLEEFVGVSAEEIDPNKIPQLDLCDRMGHTGYLDFIRSVDVPHSVMHGIDVHQRFFITIKCTDDSGEDEEVLVVFQRYTGDDSIWVNCGPLPDRLMRAEYWPRAKTLLLAAYQQLGPSVDLTTVYRVDSARPDARGFSVL